MNRMWSYLWFIRHIWLVIESMWEKCSHLVYAFGIGYIALIIDNNIYNSVSTMQCKIPGPGQVYEHYQGFYSPPTFWRRCSQTDITKHLVHSVSKMQCQIKGSIHRLVLGCYRSVPVPGQVNTSKDSTLHHLPHQHAPDDAALEFR
jgi:hypothetical protein